MILIIDSRHVFFLASLVLPLELVRWAALRETRTMQRQSRGGSRLACFEVADSVAASIIYFESPRITGDT